MAQLLKTRHILAVHNLRLSTDFYVNVLGFSRDFGDESDGWSWLSREHFHVGLGECPDSLPARALGDHSYFAYVTVADVDALFTEFVGRGAPVQSSPTTKPWGMREFAIATPDGHRLTFGQEVP